MPKYSRQLAAILFLFAAASCFLTAAFGSPEERTTRMIVGGVIAALAGTILFFDILAGVVAKVEKKSGKESRARPMHTIKEKAQYE